MRRGTTHVDDLSCNAVPIRSIQQHLLPVEFTQRNCHEQNPESLSSIMRTLLEISILDSASTISTGTYSWGLASVMYQINHSMIKMPCFYLFGLLWVVVGSSWLFTLNQSVISCACPSSSPISSFSICQGSACTPELQMAAAWSCSSGLYLSNSFGAGLSSLA